MPTFEKPIIPPFFGLPEQKDVTVPQSTPWSIQIVRIDERDQQLEKLSLVAIPMELRVMNEANWQVIPSIGRNNPFYNYTGGEDILEFTIDWYSRNELRDDVIWNCRWLESLTRANAYRSAPDRVILLWGDLFKYTTWIVTSAQYRLELFDIEKGLLPRQAYQDVTLKKVAKENTSIVERRTAIYQ